MLRTLSAALAALALLPVVAAAQETYQIKAKEPAQGDTAVYRKHDKLRADVKLADGNGNALEEKKESKTDDLAYRQTVLEKPAGAKRADKLRRFYTKAERTEDGRKEALPYQGKTVLIEKKGGRYAFRIEGGQELTGKDAQELNEEFNKGVFQNLGHEWVLPQKAVRIGETWKIDPTPLVKEVEASGELKLDGAKSSGTGKLVRAYKKDGRQYGVIDLELDVPVREISGNGATAKAKDSKLKIRLALDGCIDGSSFAYSIKGTVRGNIDAAFDVMGMAVRLTVHLEAEMDEARQEAAKE
jgi:hypothetical protein